MLKKLVKRLPEPLRTKVRNALGIPQPGHMSIGAVVIRADGTIEDLGIISEEEVEFEAKS